MKKYLFHVATSAACFLCLYTAVQVLVHVVQLNEYDNIIQMSDMCKCRGFNVSIYCISLYFNLNLNCILVSVSIFYIGPIPTKPIPLFANK